DRGAGAPREYETESRRVAGVRQHGRELRAGARPGALTVSTRFKNAIEDLLVRRRAPARPAIEPAILRMARELPEGAADLPSAKNYDEISARLAATLDRGERLTKMQARDGAWCLWETEVAIAERADLLPAFLAQLRALRHKGASRALALSYLISFQMDGPGFSAVAAALRDLAPV